MNEIMKRANVIMKQKSREAKAARKRSQSLKNQKSKLESIDEKNRKQKSA